MTTDGPGALVGYLCNFLCFKIFVIDFFTINFCSYLYVTGSVIFVIETLGKVQRKFDERRTVRTY
jgi:hypothetical protein